MQKLLSPCCYSSSSFPFFSISVLSVPQVSNFLPMSAAPQPPTAPASSLSDKKKPFGALRPHLSSRYLSFSSNTCCVCRLSLTTTTNTLLLLNHSPNRSLFSASHGSFFSHSLRDFSVESNHAKEKTPFSLRLNRRQKGPTTSSPSPSNPDLLAIPGVGPRNFRKLVQKGIAGVAQLKQLYKDKVSLSLSIYIYMCIYILNPFLSCTCCFSVSCSVCLMYNTFFHSRKSLLEHQNSWNTFEVYVSWNLDKFVF